MFKRKKARKGLQSLPWHIQELIIEFCMLDPQHESVRMRIRDGDRNQEINLDMNYPLPEKGRSYNSIRTRLSFLHRRQDQSRANFLSPTQVCREYFDLGNRYYYSRFLFWVRCPRALQCFAEDCPNRSSQIRRLSIGTKCDGTTYSLKLSDSQCKDLFAKFSGLRTIRFPMRYNGEDFTQWMKIALQAHPSLEEVEWGVETMAWRHVSVHARPNQRATSFVDEQFKRMISEALQSPTLNQAVVAVVKACRILNFHVRRNVSFLYEEVEYGLAQILWQLAVLKECLKVRKNGQCFPNGASGNFMFSSVLRALENIEPRLLDGRVDE